LLDEPPASPEAGTWAADAAPLAAAPAARPVVGVLPAPVDDEVRALAQELRRRYGDRLHLGTSSWSFPGWTGLVWGKAYSEPKLAREGLGAYAQHPLLSTVSLDRAFYRPLDAATYARLAHHTPEAFRFVVKAAAMVCDAAVREPGSGAALQDNPLFLDVQTTVQQVLRPAVQGLGKRLGVLVFQLSPLPAGWLLQPQALSDRFEQLWPAVKAELPAGSLAALELRDARMLTPALAAQLKAHGIRFALGLHDRMPAVAQQLPMLRATWPGDLVCRWNLQRGIRYNSAKDLWAPFDRLQAPDPATRGELARVIAGTLAAGYRAYVTINNKAEGSAPLSVQALAHEVLAAADRTAAAGHPDTV
jgi:uncharacterized protein YecE (DUF72 family)